MGKLDALRISECPAALADFARKHNALVDLLANMQGAVVAENNIVVTGSAGTGSGSYTEGAAVTVPGATGLLNLVVKHSTWTAPTTFPTQLGADNGTVSVRLNASGCYVSSSSSSAYSQLYPGNCYIYTTAGKLLQVTEWDVCNSGSPGKAVFVSSDPY